MDMLFDPVIMQLGVSVGQHIEKLLIPPEALQFHFDLLRQTLLRCKCGIFLKS